MTSPEEKSLKVNVHIPSSKRIMNDNGTETRTNVTNNEQALHRDAAVMVGDCTLCSPV